MKRIQIRFISLISENFLKVKRAHPKQESTGVQQLLSKIKQQLTGVKQRLSAVTRSQATASKVKQQLAGVKQRLAGVPRSQATASMSKATASRSEGIGGKIKIKNI